MEKAILKVLTNKYPNINYKESNSIVLKVKSFIEKEGKNDNKYYKKNESNNFLEKKDEIKNNTKQQPK
jgi:hypothetical protein